MSDEIRAYWDERAAASAGAQRTTDDVWLRVLERRVVASRLGSLGDATVVDAGCGDGATILELAAQNPDARFIGVDFSGEMVAVAQDALAVAEPAVRRRVRFVVGDVRSLDDALDDPVDVVLSDRCLINLPSEDDQHVALAAIARCLVPGGRYVAIENFRDGHDAMNEARTALGLSAISIRWHNHFLDEARFLSELGRWFEDVVIDDFSSTYYLVTRVAYSAMCAAEGTTPDYDHPLHRIAVDMPPSGRFSPIRLVGARRSTTA